MDKAENLSLLLMKMALEKPSHTHVYILNSNIYNSRKKDAFWTLSTKGFISIRSP